MSRAPRNAPNEPSESRPWFREDEGPAVQDFWQVYEDRFDELEPPDDDRERTLAVLSEAIRSGDFAPYEELLVGRAELRSVGVAPEDEVVQRVRRLTPHLVRAYNDTPDRLIAVLDVVGEFLARSTSVLTGAAHESYEAALRASHQQLRSLAKSVEASREEERTRIARELHDELGQNLTATRMDIGWLLPRLREAPPEITERLHAMSAIVDSVFKMVRRIGTDLRPGILDDLGLPDAIEWQAAEFERRSGIKVDMDVSQELADIDRSRSTALFRMFQEMLTNVARHAKARNVVGRLALEDDAVMLEVSDDGRGIRKDELTNGKSLGLLGMRERAAMHGGTFSIRRRSRSGGTVVTVSLPRDEQVTS